MKKNVKSIEVVNICEEERSLFEVDNNIISISWGKDYENYVFDLIENIFIGFVEATTNTTIKTKEDEEKVINMVWDLIEMCDGSYQDALEKIVNMYNDNASNEINFKVMEAR